MTEIQTLNSFAPAAPAQVAPVVTKNIIDLAQWAQEAQAVNGLAQGLSNTAFVPREFQGSPDNVTAAILKGKSLGLDPMAALEGIYVVHGRPGLYAKTMLRLVQAAGHNIVAKTRTEQQVTVAVYRHGKPTGEEYTWTIQRATNAGYTSNAKYKTNPTEMLHWKAISEACKYSFQDVLGGVSSVEDLETGEYDEPGEIIDETPSAQPVKKVQRKPRQVKKAPEPVAPSAINNAPAEEEPPATVDVSTGEVTADAPADEVPEVKTIGKPVQGKISSALEALGYTDRSHKLEYVRQLFGLEALDSVAALTVEQGKQAVEYIEGQAQVAEAERWAPAL